MWDIPLKIVHDLARRDWEQNETETKIFDLLDCVMHDQTRYKSKAHFQHSKT